MRSATYLLIFCLSSIIILSGLHAQTVDGYVDHKYELIWQMGPEDDLQRYYIFMGDEDDTLSMKIVGEKIVCGMCPEAETEPVTYTVTVRAPPGDKPLKYFAVRAQDTGGNMSKFSETTNHITPNKPTDFKVKAERLAPANPVGLGAN